eukprot:TRINITY_DN27197_c0_g1_i1.p1 TRINITY_DN27197_c0_g1~~TRINITY_DN27197_c0_g1_i1.p1  ORF type:complete len:281 (-),score=46.25 TRINITY_DN27197_c0_g1_i1:167-1009(-)
MPTKQFRTAEDEEFEEADAILAELRRKAETGESDVPWGNCTDRSWNEDGTLIVTRVYAASKVPGAPQLKIRELPYAAHPCSGDIGTGGVVWWGALALNDFLQERRNEIFAGVEVILEIGAGCGLVGLCAASLLPEGAPRSCRVILTDGPDACIDNLQRNINANAAALERADLEAAKLVWEDLLDGTAAPPVDSVDLLLGSDVIWGGRASLVGGVCRKLVKPGGCLLISAQEGREGLDEFEAILRGNAEGLEGTNFDVEVQKTASSAGEAFVLFICRRLQV